MPWKALLIMAALFPVTDFLRLKDRIGCASLYALDAMSEAVVTKALQIIRKELDLTMAFRGKTDINALDKGILLAGSYPEASTPQQSPAGLWSACPCAWTEDRAARRRIRLILTVRCLSRQRGLMHLSVRSCHRYRE